MDILIENQYLAPVYSYSALIGSANAIISLSDPYERRSFRNRCILAGANGPITLSIPLEGGRNQKSFTRDIRIANRYRWQHDHTKTIESCYRRTPWYEDIAPFILGVLNREYAFLHDLNIEMMSVILKLLKLQIDIVSEKDASGITSHIPRAGRVTPANYYGLPCMTYVQVFQDKLGFLPNLSIIDLLFCMGPGSRDFLIRNKESFAGLS